MFFVIHCSDGDTTVQIMDREQLRKGLNNGDFGPDPQFVKQEALHDHGDPNYWCEAYLIVEGAVFIPTPKQVVKEYEV